MTVRRINGIKVNLEKLTDDELFRLGGHIRRNIDQAEAHLQLVDAEMARRGMFLEPGTYEPAS